ncbi:MAG TPA: ROK family protein [Lachnospiraceae bacterium]
MVKGSKSLIRDINTQLVLKTIMEEGSISRATLSKKLGLTKATISAIVQELLNKHLVREIGTLTVSSGRKPILLEFASDCAYAISLDISQTQITILSATLAGENCVLHQYPTKNKRDCILEELESAILSQLEDIPNCPYGLIGITLGIHGIIHEEEILFTSYSDYAHLDFISSLREKFQVPVYVVNEANLSALGDYSFHYPGQNVVELSIHSGIGLGIILNKQLFLGSKGYAGEFGHTTIQIDGRPCPCGNFGCLEQYASERAILSDFATESHRPFVNCDEFISLYQKKEPIAIKFMNHFIKYMALAVNNILNTLDPDLIILNSSFTMNFPHLVDDIKASVCGRHHKEYSLLPSELQDMSILLGGICYSKMEFLKTDFTI